MLDRHSSATASAIAAESDTNMLIQILTIHLVSKQPSLIDTNFAIEHTMPVLKTYRSLVSMNLRRNFPT
jgi:hypothetical protein